MLTTVIPTKNRPNDLIKAVTSILAQTRLPDELIIVDQSFGIESRHMVESVVADQGFNKLIYIHDTTIKGLVDAKRVAYERATGDIICFLEDDVILESCFIEQIDLGFSRCTEMLGCCGIIINPPRQPRGYIFFYRLFHLGIFHDPRVKIYGSFKGLGHDLILCDVLSGGLSAWRREVFSFIGFDVINQFFMMEDIDFSTRVVYHFGHLLYINPNARLAHYSSPVNRKSLGPRERQKICEYAIYYKKRARLHGATLAFIWVLLGLFIEAILQTLRSRNNSPLVGFFSGLNDGIKRKIK